MKFTFKKNFTSVSVDPYVQQINAEAIRILFANMTKMAIAVILLISVVMWVMWGRIDDLILLLWGSVGFVLAAIQLWMGKAYMERKPPATQAVRWARYFTINEVMFGIHWGCACIIFFIPNSVPLQVFTFTCIIGIAMTTIIHNSYWIKSYYAFIIPLLSISFLRLLWERNPEYYGLAALSMMLLVLVIHMAHEWQKTILTTIRLRFENIDLVEHLRIAKEKAESANIAKSKFLAAASHDLRQPIHAQGLFLDVLSRTELNSYQRELLRSSRVASVASSDMLNTLLDFSRIEAGVIEPQIKAFSLQSLLHKMENDLAPQADAKNIVYRSRDTHLVVRSDPVLLELIFRNLISNAIRYTQRGGVLVGCRRRGNQVSVEVWDTGIGIPPENQQEIFREFHQLGNPERDRQKGLGLGLAIAQGMANTLGHPLSLVSTPQRGSVFKLLLPITTASILPEHIQAQMSKEKLREVHILFIDDDEIVREGMQYLIRDWGCTCDVAETIEEALMLAREQPPSLVISDYRLREQRTGAEAIVALRTLLGQALPAILITGDTAPERLREAQSSGVPLLHKPVSSAELYQKVIAILEKNN